MRRQTIVISRFKSSQEGLGRGFSCPQEGPDAGVMGAITTTYAREYIRRFVEQFGPELDRRGKGLPRVLQHWLDRRIKFEHVWDLAVAGARQAVLRKDPATLPRRAASLALHLHACGTPGSWELDLAGKTRLRWGRWLLPEADCVCVKATESQAVVRLCRGRSAVEVTFRRRGGRWLTEGAAALPVVGSLDCPIVLFNNPAIDGLEFGGPLRFARVPLARIVKQCDAAVALLRRHAPIYLRWVKKVVRSIVPVDANLSGIIAGSDFTKPGVVQVSFPVGTVLLAETLVHEASHQHLEIVRRLGPVHSGSDQALYYSPIRKAGRPIDKILVAYHAMVNVLLFYRLCRQSGLRDGGYIKRREGKLLSQLEELEAPLRRTRALTPLGRALWEPLAERIHNGTRS
jgi:HEXXH motif-containing protein